MDGVQMVALAAALVQSMAIVWHIRNTGVPRGWQTTSGTVVTSTVESFSVLKRGYVVELHRPIVGYTYEVDGERYKSKRFWLIEPRHNLADDAENEIGPYPPGTTVKVFYDPKLPRFQSLVKPGPRSHVIWFSMSALLLDVVSVFVGFTLLVALVFNVSATIELVKVTFNLCWEDATGPID